MVKRNLLALARNKVNQAAADRVAVLIGSLHLRQPEGEGGERGSQRQRVIRQRQRRWWARKCRPAAAGGRKGKRQRRTVNVSPDLSWTSSRGVPPPRPPESATSGLWNLSSGKSR